VKQTRLFQAAQRHLPFVHFVADSALWAIAIPTGVLLRYDFDVESVWESDIAIAIAVAVVLQGVFGFLYGLYRRRWRYGSFDEVRIVALTALSVGVVMTIVWWGGSDAATRSVPRSVPLLATAISLLGQIAVRSMWRLYTEHRDRPGGDHLQRVVIVGAGEAGEQVLRTLRSVSTAPYVPVAMVDDDPVKRNLRMMGVKVEGRVDELVSVAKRSDATAV
jgi:dTDP-glucose 4,6-dehydratase